MMSCGLRARAWHLPYGNATYCHLRHDEALT
jgi:hypothetical protein